MTAAFRTALVIGAGALGAACARLLAERGLAVTLVDQGGESASAVAAGMLAPAFEAALDGVDLPRASLFRAGRDNWSGLAARAGLELHRDGARWVAWDAEAVALGEALSHRMRALGFAVVGPAAEPRTPDDWRLDPAEALSRLTEGLRVMSVRVEAAGADDRCAWTQTQTGERLEADLLVLATGAGALDCRPAESALSAVRPIKGQILDLPGVSAPGGVLRGPGVYVTPSTGGVRIGATMQKGAWDTRVDPAATEALLSAGARIWPSVHGATSVTARAGVRGASPDGLPLAGPAGARVAVALAPRRNGWLLAALVAQVVAAYATGDDPGPFAAALDPLRFQTS